MGPKRKEVDKIPDQNEERKMWRNRQNAESKKRVALKRKVDQYGECVAGDSITKGAGIGTTLNMEHGDLFEDIILGSNDAETSSPKSPAALAFNSQRNSYAEEKLDVIEREAKEYNRKHAAKVAEEVATMISRVPEYVFDAYEDGCQGDGGSLVDFTTIEKEATEENAAHIARIEADKKKQESEWSKRVTIDTETWNEFTPRLLDAFVSAEACDAERCDNCKQELTIIIRCLDDCKSHLCPDCDVKIHSTRPFHDRKLFLNEFESRPLLTHEFYGVENRPLNIGMRVFVPVSCRTEKCKKLGTKGTLVLVAGTKYCTVISGEGRFDLHCAAFKCSRCDGVMNAELEDYIGSGYWPGNPKTLGIFFTTSFLKLYFHLKNYLPGSSEYGLLKALGAFSADAGRENTISNAFSRASRMYYYITHLADRDIKQQRKLSCRACSNKCCAVHFDGNHKLVRRKSKLKQRLLKGVDMTKGETYSHTLLLLEHIYGLQDPEHANLLFKT
ncbi:hypothetical protein DAPPUDRAFT_323731 [Daphnia pulex]|uniref:CxC3 like cysteine cluster domain-containing protein n=1 Tax=Daphnia pulex TaxID=6669 RepID=E9GZL7_DAPPU|nr:hypothetical protein DAPPUDRAFT_323731 [Daphnia pulex]|eukprot:EFX75085.1 hypothetical protein DAPPUDRAFT_323731 [Daphnia pulex]